jgi:hypothetical protein
MRWTSQGLWAVGEAYVQVVRMGTCMRIEVYVSTASGTSQLPDSRLFGSVGAGTRPPAKV